MKRLLAYLSVITVLLALAATAFAFRSYQNKMAVASEAFSALDFDKTSLTYDEIEGDLGKWRLSRILLSRQIADVRDRRDEVRYWQKDYDHLIIKVRDAEDSEDMELSQRIKFVATNALYRSIVAETDRKTLVTELTGIADRYKNIVDNNPENFDAAFNYEYLLRMIEKASNSKQKLPLESNGQVIHGLEGGTLEAEGADKIKIFVPKGDEPDDSAGTGDAQRKKG